jgi:hypothetical protein
MTGPVDPGRVAEHRDHGGLRVVVEDDSIDINAAERAVRACSSPSAAIPTPNTSPERRDVWLTSMPSC